MNRSRLAAFIAAAALVCQSGAAAYAAEEPMAPQPSPLLTDTAEPETEADAEAPAEEAAPEDAAPEDAAPDSEGSGDAEEEQDTSGWITSGEWSYSVIESGIKLEACTSQEKQLIVPESIDGLTVTEIGRSAFRGVPAASVTLPATVEYISSDNPFSGAEELQEIRVADGSRELSAEDGVLFNGDKSRLLCYPRARVGTSYTIPQGVKEIGSHAFDGCGISGITFPSSLEKTGRESFSGCSHLGSADLSGTSLTSIETRAFYKCSDLKEVKLPDTLTEVGKEAFMGAGLPQADIPDSVTVIGEKAFGYFSDGTPDTSFIISGSIGSAAETYASECTVPDSESDGEENQAFLFLTHEQAAKEQEYLSMKTVTSTDGDYVYTIKSDGTAGLISTNLTSEILDIPSQIDGVTVTSIIKRCFMFSYATNITIPDTVTEIGEDAFYNCVYLQNLNLPGSLQKIEGEFPFSSCYSLLSINVNGSGGAYASEDGVLYNSDKSVVIRFPAAKEGAYVAPSSVREIGAAAFADCGLLESADISSATVINDTAFFNCQALSSVLLSKDLTSVGTDAFFDCYAFQGVRLYNKVESIGDYAFGYIEEESTDEDSEGELITKINEKFKMYVDKDSAGWKYATDRGIETVTGTVPIRGRNVSVMFLIVSAAAIAAAVLALIGILIGKRSKKKKEEKRIMAIKTNAAERIRAKHAKEKKEADK